MSKHTRICLLVALLTFTLLPVLPGGAQPDSAFYRAVTNLNPAAYWPLQETMAPPAADVEPNLGWLGSAGNAYYSSTNIVRGVTPGGIPADADPAAAFQSGLNGSFLAVPLTDSRVALPVGPFTVELWIYPTNTSASTVIAQTGVAGSGGLNGGTNSAGWSVNLGYVPSLSLTMPNTICFHVYNGVGSAGGAEATFTASSSMLSTWNHVVAVFDGTTAKLYVNNVPGASMLPMTGTQARDTWDPLTIGCGRGLNNNRFGGSLDEIAIYTSALTFNQLSNHYYTASAGGYVAAVQADHPCMYWRLNAPMPAAPSLDAYPVAYNYGALGNVNGLYLQGTIPGVQGPTLPGLGSSSYACAFNGIGTAATNAIPLYTNGAPLGSIVAASGVVITNLDPAFNLRTNNLSVAYWFKGIPADTRWNAMFCNGDKNWRSSLDNVSSRIRWNGGQGAEIMYNSGCNDGNWHFLVCTYTNTGVPTSNGVIASNYVYVDGIQAAVSAPTTTNVLVGTNLMIGGSAEFVFCGNGNNYSERFFAGSLAHIAYFTNTLSAADVANLYVAAGGTPLPVITGQPVSDRINGAAGNNGSGSGSYIYFGVQAKGATGYQWFFNSSSNYAGATLLTDDLKYSSAGTSQVTVTNLADSDSGYYYVVVTNNYGSTTSRLASLTVSTEPFLVSQDPPGGTVQLYQGQNDTLSLSLAGQTNFTYQWYTNDVADTAAGTAATYQLVNVQPAMSGRTYRCVISNAAGSTTNATVTLSVLPLPANLASSTYSSTLLGLSPLGYWPMHEVASPAPGDVENNLGSLGNLANGYYADWAGNTPYIVHSAVGALAGDSDPCVLFNNTPNGGNPGYLVIPRTSPSTTLQAPFSLEAWVKPNNAGFGDIICQGPWNVNNNGANSGTRYGLRLCWGTGGTSANGAADFQVYIGPGTGTGNPGFPSPVTQVLPIGQWYHVVLSTPDNTNWTLYVNGQVHNSFTQAMGIDTRDPIIVGQGLWQASGPGRAFPGSIDEVAIYTNVLDPNEVYRHYTVGLDPAASPTYKQLVLATNPIVYLRMDAPAYTAPALSTWPVMANYGSLGASGLYSPGSLPGLLDGPNAIGLAGTKALPLNGMSSFADAGFDPAFNPTTNAFSFSAWFKGYPTDTRTNLTILGHSDSSWRAQINMSGKLVAHGGADLTSPAVVNDGTWHHFALTYSGTNAATQNFGTNVLYLDGAQVATSLSGGNAGSTLNVLFGNDPQYTNNPVGVGRALAGSVCEVAFWSNVALSSNQVLSLWNAAGVPPLITSQPIAATNSQGTTFTNTVSVSGSAPLAYQWYQNSAPLSGQTSSRLMFPALVDANAGAYFVVVTNLAGAVTSSVVTLTVIDTPLILSQLPVTYTNLYTLYAGASPTFTLTSVAGQAPLFFQWFTNGVLDPSATSTNYQADNLPVGGFTNFCVVTNSLGAATSFVWRASVIAAPTAPYPHTVLTHHPVAYWRLDEADDNLNDGNPGALAHDYRGGNNGLYAGTALGQVNYSLGLANQYGNAAFATDPSPTAAKFGTFGTSSNYAGSIQGPDFAAPTNTSGAFSIEAWVNGDANPTATAAIAAKGAWGAEQFTLDTTGNKRYFRFTTRDAGNVLRSATSTNSPDGYWHHLVGVLDQPNSNLCLYVDGALVAASACSPSNGVLSTSVPISLGCRLSNAGLYDQQFIGTIDDVALYDYALTAEQVAAHYAVAGTTPKVSQQPPPSVALNEGETLTLAAAAVGTAPLSYQWYDNFGGIANQANPTLVIPNVPVTMDNDLLYLQVTNAYGLTVSAYVSLRVYYGAPQLAASNLPPQVILPLGKSFTYSVQAVGTAPLSYQWYNGASPLPGQTGTNYTVTATAPGTSTISVLVSNSKGSIQPSSLLTVVTPPTDPYAAAVLNSSPAGYWPLQDTGAPAPATMETNYGRLGPIGNAYYAVNSVASPQVTFGAGGALSDGGAADNAVAFSGTGGYLGTNYLFVPHASPALTLKAPLSFEVWLNSSSTKFADILGQGGSGLNHPFPSTTGWSGIRFSYGGNVSGGPGLQAFVYKGGNGNYNSFSTPANSLPLSQWHHCVMTFDGTACILYIDGQPQATNTTFNAMVPDTCSPLTIGDGRWLADSTSSLGPTRSFNGTLDEVAVYTNVLSPDQIKNHWTTATNPNANYFQTVVRDQPLLYYRMNAQGFVAPNPATSPMAVNYGSAAPNGAYLAGILPGGLPGPAFTSLPANLAAPINGVSSCIDAGNDPAFNPSDTQPFSVVLWFKGYPADGRVQTLMSHGVNNWAMNLDGGTGHVVWNLYNGGNVTSSAVLNDGNWHMLAGICDGAAKSLYVDGNLDVSAALTAGVTGDSTANLYLGGNCDYTSIGVNQRYFAGALSQVAYWTNALSGDQIQSLYNLAATPTISIQPLGNQVRITYSGALYSSTNATGPYTLESGATSPYTIPAAGAQRFYRSASHL